MPQLVDQFGNPISSPAPRSRPQASASMRRVSARYDAAATTSENARHWANADGLSADAAANPEVRRRLRNRARYEAVESNCYAKGIVRTLANDCIGTRPRLQIETGNPAANRAIEKAFHKWAKEIKLGRKLRTMRRALAVDGEAFAVFVTNPKLKSPVQLSLQLIEADQVTTPDLDQMDENSVDGIKFDQWGNPVEYHILRNHPGSDSIGVTGLAWEYDRVPAEQVIHLFDEERAGQRRGVPEIAPGLPLCANLRRYSLAVLGAAETAADFAAVLYTDAPAIDEVDEVEPLDALELEKRMMTTLPMGWKLGQLKAEQPSTGYAEFKGEVLNEFARCVNMPYNVAAGNSSGYNYASGRLDHQVYFRSIRITQADIEDEALDRILAAWLDEALLIPGLIPTGIGLPDDWDHKWMWDGHEHVDPVKEASAEQTRLASHTTTLAELYARRGKDWETELRQRAREVALMKELGLTDAQAIPRDESTDEDEEEAEDAEAETEAATA